MNRLFFLLTFVVPTICTAQSAPESRSTSPLRWDAPELERSVAVRDGRTGRTIAFSQLLDDLAKADAVFLGELHTDETTHRVELGVYEGLADRRGGKVVLAMEMFERDVQGALDTYLAGDSSEHEFLAASRPWKNYDTAYRPLVEFAKSRELPVVASNFPRPARRSLSRLGEGATLEDLEGAARSQAPKRLYPNSPAYWRRVDNAIRGHSAMMGAKRSDDERLYSTQSLWDNSMGEACAIALDEHPGSSVLHVNGGFHSAYWDGTVRQLRLRKPDANVLTVSIVPSSNPSIADPGGAAVADYVVYAEARATDLNEGTHSVYVQQEVKYRLHVPKTARGDNKVPLLIWFVDDGLTAEDGMALWRGRLGEECAIAVLEAPYRETQDDLVEGGRWFWPDSFSSDLGSMGVATEKIWAYLLRHFPLDSTRVCIAGEGTGATVVSAVSLMSSRMEARAVAFSPRRYAKLKDIPLPLPEFRGGEPEPKKSLRLVLAAGDESWWDGELAAYEGIGFEANKTMVSQDPWLLEVERASALRAALRLSVPAPTVGSTRRHVLAETPRARHWARLLGIEEAKKREGVLVAILDEPPTDGSSDAIEVGVRPDDFKDGRRIPRCPGPFGGTTVVVLPESSPSEFVEAWKAIEGSDPLSKRSRFHRLRVAVTGGDRGLPTVLAELADKGRKNVLVIPAVFCADGETMRALKRSVRALEDQITLRWRPGLGG